MGAKKAPLCPCGSNLALRACCQRFFDGAEPEDAPTLVRSRFAAFALGRAEYLWRTLHPDHPLRARPEAEVLRELRRAHEELRYRSVVVHDSRSDERHARVLFTARVFRSGRDVSFVELSDFERIGGGWRYASCQVRDARELREPTFDAFESAF